jgi:hypothetical protein
MPVSRLPATATPEDVATVLERDAVVVIVELIGADAMDRARDQ